MKRNSWFIVKYEDTVDLQSTSWWPAGKKFKKHMQKALEVDPKAAFQAQMNLNLALTTKRTYWVEDWKETDPLEGGSVWTDYRREAIKFQKRTDAEDFAFQRTRDFPPYIGLLKVERLRWNPTAKGPCGPVVAMYSLAT